MSWVYHFTKKVLEFIAAFRRRRNIKQLAFETDSMRLVQWGHWNSNNVLTETTLLVNFDTHANNLKSFFLEQHVSVANFEKLFKSVFHLPNRSSLWSRLILKFRLNGAKNSRWFTSFISRLSHKILMYFSSNFGNKDDALFTISTFKKYFQKLRNVCFVQFSDQHYQIGLQKEPKIVFVF